ncbi:uncharacterized protein LOC124897771 [Capsicum annuum]|uniref:uncharacterized protein LOC124897771 n=1 Tax=Capsicum annuum TaxID=4072 RepID=UPI001FB148E3|nr:uncharacterized protein LOC124897771 [Capsicum annuum]
MTHREGIGSDSEEDQNQLILQEVASMEELKLLKQQMAEMYQPWLNGKAPPSSIPGLSTLNDPNPSPTQTSDPFYPPGFDPFANMSGVAGNSTMRPPNPAVINNLLFTSIAPAIAGTQPTVPINMGEPSHDLLYPSEITFKAQNPHYHAYQHDSTIMIEKIFKNEEQEEITRKVRRLEQRFKMPRFDKYEGHGDPLAYLKKFCNQLRGAGGKEKLLMAYFGESLTGIASEWFIDQDISLSDRTTLANMRKKMTESFREYAIRWREQASKVRPPIKGSKMINIFLQAQEPNYFHHLLSTVRSIFAEVIKVGEMVENGIKLGKTIIQATLKAITQAIQSGAGSFGVNKRKKDVATVVPGLRQYWRGAR